MREKAAQFDFIFLLYIIRTDNPTCHNKNKSLMKPWMKEVIGIRHGGRGGQPTLPGLHLSTIQPSQRGFFRVHTSV